VVETTFEALGKKPSVIDGMANRIGAIVMALLPKKLLIKNNARLWRKT
jgi:hypothetical protein